MLILILERESEVCDSEFGSQSIGIGSIRGDNYLSSLLSNEVVDCIRLSFIDGLLGSYDE